jgi:signal transduction histidine kinase
MEFTNKEDLLLESYFSGKVFIAAVSALISIVFAYLLWDYVDHTILTVWSSVVVFGNLIRIYYTISYTKKKQRHPYQYWLKRFIIPTGFVGFSWGMISFFLINKIPDSLDYIVVCFMLGMTIGAAIGNLAHKGVSYFYTISLIGPYFIKVLIEPDEFKVAFIFAFVLFTILTLKMIGVFAKFNRDNLNLLEQRENLLIKAQKQYELEKELHEEKIKNVKNAKLISLGEITGGIAHEINNPLTIIVGKLFQLKKKIQNDGPKEDLIKEVDLLNTVALRIGNIVKVMRQLSRKDEDTQLDILNIVEMIQKSLSNVEEKLLENPISIDHSAVQNVKVLGIEEHIIQAMSNLISNAIDELKDTTDAWIRISTITENDKIFIQFTDSGFGISEEIQEKLFEPFFTTKDVGEGSGLGLSISKSLMKQITGDLYYQEKAGHTNFVIELTLVKV